MPTTDGRNFRARLSPGRLESIGAAALAEVAKIDLTRFHAKLCDTLQWSVELCQEVEQRYRMFLALFILYPGKEIVPTPFVDEFWHMHILDTVAYHRDCDQLFGSYQHHCPSFPDDSPQEDEALAAGAKMTRQFYLAYFGTEPWTDAELCTPFAE